MTKQENEERLAKLKLIVSRLPEKPGSYQFYDDSGTIIYVGKAKNLKNRVSSYFHTEVDRFKTKVLVLVLKKTLSDVTKSGRPSNHVFILSDGAKTDTSAMSSSSTTSTATKPPKHLTGQS